MRAAFCTLGCKVNQYDTQAMLESFERAGWDIVPFEDEADMYLINTCTVTGTGDQKSRKLIRRVAREHPDAGIIAAGCLAQRESGALLDMPNVRLAIGVQRRAEVVELYSRACAEGKLDATGALAGASFENLFVTRHEGKTRATMKIQEGCDRYCAYCIIPSVRGPVRSMKLEAVREEAFRLSRAGYKEIVLTGIHMASYGRGSGNALIEAINCALDTGARVRVGSLEPVIATESFAKALSERENLMRQFHLSLQSGSAGVLSRMRRRYTPGEYMRALDIIRKYMPDAAITTDVLTGFPGETDAEAGETLKFVEDARFARIHVFPYSRRKGTLADAMPEQVGDEIKKERTRELIELGNKLEEDFVKGITGTVQSVLFEARVGGYCEGYTQHYVRVRAEAEPGEVKRVVISSVDGKIANGSAYIPDGR